MSNSGGLLPVLPGSLQCGYYHFRDADGRQHKRYIRLADLARAVEELAAWRRAHPPAYQMRQALAALRREGAA